MGAKQVWGPFRGGNERAFGDYYFGVEETNAKRLLDGFDKWRQENAGKADSLTITITSDALKVGTDPDSLDGSVVGISFQSSTGDASDKAVMHVHRKQGTMIIIQRVTRSDARLIQVSAE